MMAAVTSAMTSLITMIGNVVSAIVGESGALTDLLPLFAISVAIAIFLFAVKAIRSICYGA